MSIWSDFNVVAFMRNAFHGKARPAGCDLALISTAGRLCIIGQPRGAACRKRRRLAL
ncbi:MAG: hypothetical protein HS101_17170 [Planctomycetia bacterium]|jgi:hypothetical protein|nr:hypothetical protein [Planctomycetia bacterium]MCC7315254.1 hypothetical protein [Planctomycetota bacterium]